MRVVDDLAAMKGRFGREAAERCEALLERARHARIREASELIRFHEIVLYLRAYPQSPQVLRLTDEILFSFAERLRGVDRDAFEDPEISGIAGTGLSTNFSYDVARSLVRRHGHRITIDWENYERSDRLGPTLARLIPMAREDAAVEPHVDWRAWFERAHGTIAWLLANLKPEIYDLLEIPLRWELGDSAASRSRIRIPRRNIFYHDGPFLKRSDVSLEAEFRAPKIAVRKNSPKILDVILDTSAVRYRELWGFTHPDRAHVYHADFGRGVDFFLFGVAPRWRLPIRGYHGGMFFKNGVPIGYVEGLSVAERMEVGFNLYYTFREGETAWLYAKILKIFREHAGTTCFSIDPYQLGHENDEAIDSGAFWFYRKLGFRTASKELEPVIEREESRIRADPAYRTPRSTLQRLARAPILYGCARKWDHFDFRTSKMQSLPKPRVLVW
jgi:hypothetical protein